MCFLSEVEGFAVGLNVIGSQHVPGTIPVLSSAFLVALAFLSVLLPCVSFPVVFASSFLLILLTAAATFTAVTASTAATAATVIT